MRYSEAHAWIKTDERYVATVGMTPFAVKELGEIVHVQLPRVGQRVKAGEEVAVVESTKSAIDLYAPVSGTVVEINEALVENTDAINHAPEGEGWLYRVAMSVTSELEKLLDPAKYRALVTR